MQYIEKYTGNNLQQELRFKIQEGFKILQVVPIRQELDIQGSANYSFLQTSLLILEK